MTKPHQPPRDGADCYRPSALLCAVGSTSAETVAALLDAGADPNLAANTDGKTALIQAVDEQEPAMVRLLIDAGARVDARDQDGDTALRLAVHTGQNITVRMLLEAKADPNGLAADGMTAVMDAVKNKKSVSLVRMLLQGGAKGVAEALALASEGEDELLVTLLEGWRDLTRPFADGNTPAGDRKTSERAGHRRDGRCADVKVTGQGMAVDERTWAWGRGSSQRAGHSWGNEETGKLSDRPRRSCCAIV